MGQARQKEGGTAEAAGEKEERKKGACLFLLKSSKFSSGILHGGRHEVK